MATFTRSERLSNYHAGCDDAHVYGGDYRAFDNKLYARFYDGLGNE